MRDPNVPCKRQCGIRSVLSRKYRHSWTLTIAAAFLFAAAAVVAVVIPDHIENRELNHLDDRARIVGRNVARQYGTKLLKGESEALESAEIALRAIGDYTGFVVIDRDGKLISSLERAPEGIDVSGGDSAGTDLSGSRSFRASVSVPMGPGGEGLLYISMSRVGVRQEMRNDRKAFLGFGILLLFLALLVVSAIIGVSRAESWSERVQASRHNLEGRLDELQKKVAAQTEVEKQLRESESRYRDLLESAMDSTFTDLEKLNTDLSIQKADLQHEVKAKANAQKEARRSAERLRALNEIGQAMLESLALPDIAALTLEKLRVIKPFDRASIVEFDELRGDGHILAVFCEGETSLGKDIRKPISYFRAVVSGDNEMHYVPDLSQLEQHAEIEQSLMREGIRSYLRISLMNAGQVVGTLNVGSTQPDAVDPAELQIAREVADLLSVAIRQNRHEEERDRYESELIMERDRAEEMARLKSAFLANMSHEIRTPLSGIIGFAQVMQEELNGEMLEFTDLIEQSARRLLNTINSVLDLARLEADHESVRLAPTNIVASVKDTIRLLRPLAVEKGLNLKITHSEDDIFCHLDEVRFERIVTNLVGNAIKFCDAGSVELYIDETPTHGILRVSDTGIGISEEFLPSLFDEFRQEEMGIDRGHEGSGLGLAITRRLVEKMNGSIEVASEKSVGTTFCVKFPLSRIKENEQSEIDGIGSILVISSCAREENDDWELLGSVIEIRTAPDLDQALLEAKSKRYDLLIVDTDGIDSTRDAEGLNAIREIPEYGDVAFIAVSSQALGDFEETYLKSEFDGLEMDPEGVGSYLRRLFERLRYDERIRSESRAADRESQARRTDAGERKGSSQEA
jgi:signal transduction histidine kinase